MLTVMNENAQANLMQALGFSEYDLEANRKGRLSGRQRRAIQIEGYWAVLALILITTIGLATGGLAIVSGQQMQIIGGFLIVALTVVVPSVMAWWMSRHYSRILNKGEIRKMRGKLRKQVQAGGRYGPNFKISMGDEEFPVSMPIFNAFISATTAWYFSSVSGVPSAFLMS